MMDANVIHIPDSAWCRQCPKVHLGGQTHSSWGIWWQNGPLFLSKIRLTQCVSQGLPVVLHPTIIAKPGLKLH